MQETNIGTWKTIRMILIFTFFVAFAWLYISRVGTIQNLNSDTASVVMYYLAAKEQATIAPEGWLSGSMFQVNDLFFRPVTWIVGENYVLCWNIISLLITVILFGSIVFFTKSVFHNNSWILIIPILFSSIFPQMTRLYVFYVGYSVGMILLLLFVSCFVRAIDIDWKITNKVYFITAIILLFFACAIGTQGMQMITFPVMGALALMFFSERKQAARQSIRRIQIVFLIILGGVSLAGVMLYINVIQEKFGIIGLTKVFQLKTIEDYRNLDNLLAQSIYYWLWENVIDEHFVVQNVRLFFKVVGSILLILVLPTTSIWRTVCNDKLGNGEIFESRIFVTCIAILSFFEILMIFLFSKTYTAGHHVRYFTNPFFLMGCIGVNYIYERISSGQEIKRNTLAILSAITIIINASGMYMTSDAFRTNYEKLFGIGKFLEENNLTFGYSSYWNAAVNTMITDNRIRVLNLHLNGRTIEVQGLFTCKKWYHSDYYSGKSFLMLTDTEYQNKYWYSFATKVCGEPREVLKHDGMNIFVYNYNIAEVLPPIRSYNY